MTRRWSGHRRATRLRPNDRACPRRIGEVPEETKIMQKEPFVPIAPFENFYELIMRANSHFMKLSRCIQRGYGLKEKRAFSALARAFVVPPPPTYSGVQRKGARGDSIRIGRRTSALFER